MTLSRMFNKTIVALATIGLILPNAGFAFASGPKNYVIRDVALGQGSSLRGQVISAQGAIQPNTTVSLLQNGNPVAQAVTDAKGNFNVTGLKSGLYLVSTQGSQAAVRAWAHQTAPPAAVDGLLGVPQGDVLNGKGKAAGGGAGMFGGAVQKWGGGILLLGALVTTVSILAIDSDAS